MKFCIKIIGTFLGHVITLKGVTLRPETVYAIIGFKLSETASDLKRFPAMINFYRRVFAPILKYQITRQTHIHGKKNGRLW